MHKIITPIDLNCPVCHTESIAMLLDEIIAIKMNEKDLTLEDIANNSNIKKSRLKKIFNGKDYAHIDEYVEILWLLDSSILDELVSYLKDLENRIYDKRG